MTPLNRRLLRMAGRLQAAHVVARAERRPFDLPEDSWSDARQALRRWTLARSRGWLAAAALERQSLACELEHLVSQLRRQLVILPADDKTVGVTLRTLYEELVATEEEFGGLDVDKSELVVTTEPIVLAGIRLGPFQIRLDLGRLECEAPYSVVALEPNPAASCCDTTHPHVSDDRLCPGEGGAAIAAALQDGRLFDFFTIVDRVLHTYADGSAYVELDRWFGIPCHDCDTTLDEDDACTCPACEESLCSDCLICCDDCGSGYCSNCIDRCACCDERYCSSCLAPCSRCHRDVCESCRAETLCVHCQEECAHEAEEPSDQSPVAASVAAAELAI